MNPYKDIEESSFTAAPHLAYEDIATKLLKDHYFLTALELHTELVENGKELPQLREFFSNPGNFEQHVTRTSEFGAMHRTPSQATLDSLDTARYSEDGGGDRAGSGGDVAVLEFELRKAKETINALRANLTQFADGETALDKNVKGASNVQRSLKPHEKRALNFLINEYLLLLDYKLTSITFSDENPDQEFEDWDDVGLNMPRPPNLVSLFWGNASINTPKVDASTETECISVNVDCQTYVDSVASCVGCQHSLENETHWNHELLIQTEEIELLKQKIVALETEKLNFQKLYDAAIVSLNSLTSPTSESKGLDLQSPDEKTIDIRPLTLTATENHYGSGQSTHSATPEQFEMIDTDKNIANLRKPSSVSSFDRPTDHSVHRGSVTTLDDTLSINDTGDWARLHYDYTVVETSTEMWIHSPLPATLKESILSWCNEVLPTNEPVSNDLLSELVTSEKPVTLPILLTLVADTLPRIIPHTLVARRHELTALLASCIALLPVTDSRRARLLYLLLTLVKKPEVQHTVAICEAASLIVKWGGGGELLSTIAELLGSKSAERRLLASQICIYISPYITIELCTSLLFSVVMLMCDSSEQEIRFLGLKAACLICPVADNKYSQLENILFNLLKDSNEKVVKDAVRNFVPILARSALIAGKLATDLCKRIIGNLIKSCSNDEWKTLLMYTDILKSVVLAKLSYVANVQIVKDYLTNNSEMEVNLDEVPLKSDNKCFIDMQCYVADSVDANSLVVGLNRVFKNDPEVRWPELIWFIDEVKQILQMATSTKVLNHPAIYENLISLFSCYVNNFGDKFSVSILKPIFMEIISELEQKMEKLHSVNVDSTIVLGIYLVTVLPVHEDKQNEEFLQKWIMYSSIRGLPVKTFSIPLKWLSINNSELFSFYLQHLREFAASSCESSNGAMIRVYIASLLNEVLNIAEISEECIMKILLPAVTAFLHDEDVSVRESAFTLWGSVTRYCVIHKLHDAELHCWTPLEPILTGAVNVTLTGKEGARAAEAAALLIMPSADAQVNEKAAALICALVHVACCSAECVSSVTPALQLAARHAPHPHLLPALRKLEEAVQSPALAQFKPAIEALVHTVAGGPEFSQHRDLQPKSNTNLQTAQEVGRRVSQMFQHKTNMNLPNIFKKKT